MYAYEFANFKFNPNSLVFVKGYFFFKALLSQQNKHALKIFWTYPWEGVERAVVRGLFVVEGWF